MKGAERGLVPAPQTILEACEADLQAVVDRDPACEKFSQAMLYFKGFQAIQCHRLNHWLWRKQRRELAVLLQSRVSEVLHVDIHPAAQIGRGMLMVRGLKRARILCFP